MGVGIALSCVESGKGATWVRLVCGLVAWLPCVTSIACFCGLVKQCYKVVT